MKEKNSQPITICWLRRDLRLEDNAALYHALRSGNPVLCLFIFDTGILDKITDRTDRRLVFIQRALEQLHARLTLMGSSLCVKTGKTEDVWKQLTAEFPVAAVFCNHDYEPYARLRDHAIDKLLLAKNIPFHTCKDQVIFEKEEVVKDNGTAYTIYTPYKNKWRAKLNPFYLRSYPTEKYFRAFLKTSPLAFPSLEQTGFRDSGETFPVPEVSDDLLHNYASQRDLPAVHGTSLLSVHLRFGTVSIRKLARRGLAQSDTWLNELAWREFFMQILWHFPHAEKGAFKKEYDRIQWRNDENEFRRWCEGRTGYPMVDAGMRELNATGFMHNRVRMVTASFLIKHLLIDWRWGEAYFAEKLMDFDLSANNGNWQWAASSGCDAAPYFRIFNPAEQQKKFDPQGLYIRKWIPETGTKDYPAPIVEHRFARDRCLLAYKTALQK